VGVVTSQGSNKIAWSGVVFAVAGIAVWLAIWLSFNVRAMGQHFGYLQPELELDYTMGILMWVVFAVGILMVGGEFRHMLLLGWTGKFFVVLIAMLFYEQRYESDSIAYFNFRVKDFFGMHLVDVISNIDLSPNVASGSEDYDPSKNFKGLFALVTFLIPPYFHALKIGFAFFGFLGSWYFYRAVVVALGREYPPAFYLLTFCPSIIFWSSTLGKDPLMFLFIGLYAYGGTLWLVQKRMTAFWFMGAGIFFVSLVRPWIGIIGVAVFLAASLLEKSRPWQVALIALIGGLGMVHYWENITQTWGDIVIAEFLQQRAKGVEMTTQSSGGSGAALPDFEGGSAPMIVLLVIFSGLFRPLPFDITNPFTALAAAENTIVLWLALVAIYRFRLVYLRDPLVLWPLLFSLMWAAVYGLVVMANFGTGVRYKLQTWPFLLMVITLLTHREGRALLASRVSGRAKAVGHSSEQIQ